MSDEEKKETTTRASGPKPEIILGVPIDQVPPPPWTYKALGHEKYFAIARFGGFTDERSLSKPDLDPRSFAYGIAHKRIGELLQFDLSRLTPSQRDQALVNILEGNFEDLEAYCPQAEARERVKAVVADAKKLTEKLRPLFGEEQGTPRNAEAVLFAELRKAKQV